MTAAPKSDTSPAAADVQTSVLRRLLPTHRLALAIDMSLAARGLLGARLRTEHPGWSEDEVNQELLRLTLEGAALPPHPDDGG